MESILENWPTISAVTAALAALAGLTAWGRANAEALRRVVAAIETVGQALGTARDVKAAVRNGEATLSPAARTALRHAVTRVDPHDSDTPQS